MRIYYILIGLILCSTVQAQDNSENAREFTIALASNNLDAAIAMVQRGVVDPVVGKNTALLKQEEDYLAPVRLLLAYGVEIDNDKLVQIIRNELETLRKGTLKEELLPQEGASSGTIISLVKMALGQGHFRSAVQLTVSNRLTDKDRGELMLHAILLHQLDLTGDKAELSRFISVLQSNFNEKNIVFNMLSTAGRDIRNNAIAPHVISFIIQQYKEFIRQFRDGDGDTFLHYFAYNTNPDMIRLAPRVGALIVQGGMDFKNDDNKTPEMIAQQQNNGAFVAVFNLYQAFSFLEYGASQVYNIMRMQFNVSENEAKSTIATYTNQIPYGQPIDVQSIDEKSWNQVNAILQQAS